MSLLAEWLNGSLPSRATPARAAQRRAPGADAITLSQGISFDTPTGVCDRHSCEIPAKHTRCIAFAGIKPPRENDPRAASATVPGSIATWTRSGSARAPSSSLGRGICHPSLRGHAIDGLLDILPDVLAGVGRSSGPVMNSVASRCARRGASGDHDQTKPLTPQPPSKTSRADLRLRRAAGARTPLIPARDRPSRWPGFGQRGWERHTRIALALAISLGSKSMALGCASQVLVAPGPLRSS